jgi:integrase
LKAVGQGWIDIDAGVFYRLPKGRKKTKKQQPPVPLSDRLLAHLRRWKRLGQRFVVEWNGKPVKDCDKAFRNAVRDAGLDSEVTPQRCGTRPPRG